MLDEQKVQRTIKQPEGGTFAGTSQRRTVGKLPASLDIGRRQGSKRS